MIARELVAIPSYAREVEEGLLARPKTLPSKLFYDGPGSALFEEITLLPEYYLTRTELEILQEKGNEIALASGPNVTVVELGAGTATKTSTLLKALARKQIRISYVPVDISPSALEEATLKINSQCPQAYVRPVVADFSEGFRFLRKIPGRKLVLYLGSSIGNFDEGPAIEMLSGVRNELKRGDSLLLGTDLAKDPSILIPAYDDSQGVTARFDKNILQRLNREIGANFDLNSFRHIAEWNPRRSRMEIFLESLCRQKIELKLLQLRIELKPGERIHTENSYKYTLPMVDEILRSARFSLKQTWFDRRKWFALHMARVETHD